MNKLSRWGIWALPGWHTQDIDQFAVGGAKWFAVLRGEWDAALKYAGDFENILLRIMDDWGRWEPQKLNNPEYHHLRFIWSKDNFKIEDLASECRTKGSKLWIAGDFIPHLLDENACREYAQWERLRAEAILDRPGLEDVGVVILNLARGTYNEDGAQWEWFAEAVALVDKYPGRVLIGLQDFYASTWPWTWTGLNQGADININPFPDVHDPTTLEPAYLLGAFKQFVPPEFWSYIISCEAGWDISLPPMPYDVRGWLEARRIWADNWPTGQANYPGHIPALIELMRWMDDLAIEYGLAGLIYYSATGAGAEQEWPDMVLNDPARIALAEYIVSRGVGVPEPPEPPAPNNGGEPSEDVIGDLQAARSLVKDFKLETEVTAASVLVHIQMQKEIILELLDGVITQLEEMVDDLQ